MRFSVRHSRVAVLLALFLPLQGCATLRSWFRSAGTYALAAPSPAALDGRGEVHGHLYLTPSLSDVMMEGRQPRSVSALRTTVAVSPVGLELETDHTGRFVLSQLEPGDYSIAFQSPGGREIWAAFEVEADQRLDVVVWVQWGGAGENSWSEGTTPMGMFPGAGGAYGISSGSSDRSSGGRGRSGSGGSGGSGG